MVSPPPMAHARPVGSALEASFRPMLRPPPNMKKLLAPLGAALGLAFLVSGCESTGRTARIQEKSAVYATLTPQQKKAIDEGMILPDFTADMVYMAVGHPDKVKSKDTPEGRTEMWTYTNYYPTTAATNMTFNTPGARYATETVSANAPSHGSGGSRGSNPSSFSGAASGPTASMTLSDMPAHTLYVFLFNGKVFDAKVD